MTERKVIDVTLACYTPGSSTGMPERNLFAFLEEMRVLLDRVPADHRADVQIEFDACSDREGYPEPIVRVHYRCPETDDERMRRLAEEKAEALAAARRIRGQARNLVAYAAELGIPLAELGFDDLCGAEQAGVQDLPAC